MPRQVLKYNTCVVARPPESVIVIVTVKSWFAPTGVLMTPVPVELLYVTVDTLA